MRRVALAAGLAAGLACASIAPPPGGPSDREVPFLVSVSPDSLRVLADFDDDVEFRFNEVVAEGGSPNFGLGTGDLERVILVSPSDEVPRVSWKRDRITVRAREGWQPNRVYRVELLPGIADLRGNRTERGRVVTFSTGAPVPVTTLRGMVVDWNTQRPHRQGLVEAVLLSDSLAYRAITDSAGRFLLGPLPRGDYLVYGVIDQNTDRRRQLRESFDSVRVAAGRDSVGEVWAFRHDTLPVRMNSAELRDSLSIGLTFSQQVDPYQRLPADSVEVRQLPDSTPLPVLAILPQGAFDTAYPAARPDSTRAAADSARARADSIRADSIARAREAAEIRIAGTERRRPQARDTAGTGPLRTKPPLFDRLFVRVGTRLLPGTRYVIIVHGLKSVSGVPSMPVGVLQVPAARAPADSGAKRDTAVTPIRPASRFVRPSAHPPVRP
jgi:hypothetical protein